MDKRDVAGAMGDRCRTRTLLALLGALAVVGCAARQTRDEDTHTVVFRGDAAPVQRMIPTPLEAVWAAIPPAFRSLGYTGGPSTSPRERVYLTPYLLIRGRLYEGELNSLYFDCGANPSGPVIADTYPITFAILVRVKPETESATLVEVLVDGNATDRSQRATSVPCTGTGRLEKAILERIESLLRQSAR